MTDLEFLMAHQAISTLKARYCRMLDMKDWEGLANIMIEDFVMDVSEGSGLPVIHGRDAAIRQVQSSLATAKTVHHVHAPEIQVSGDEASAIWPMQDHIVWGTDRSLTGYGHYHERYVRRNAEWKIASLRLTRLHIDLRTGQAV